VSAVVHFEHELLIGCDIKPESVEKSRDVENESISEKNGVYTGVPGIQLMNKGI
jgi:hypothetical protein